ncbi:hypothetical protein [Legionella sp. W05-934-2]|uniref:hypothetical protein n=1 Tax=Legionella sp. W05-934-2 TaxID=1198649 RepID=UPI003461F1BA
MIDVHEFFQTRFSQLTLFNNIYQHVKVRNDQGIRNAVADTKVLDDNYDLNCQCNPFVDLAQKGDHESLAFLQEVIGLPDSVIKGYAMANNHLAVDEIVKKGQNSPQRREKLRTLAGQGYSLVGNMDKANEMLLEGGDRHYIITALAIGGHTKLVKNATLLGRLMEKMPKEFHAIELAANYATGGFVAEAEKQYNIAIAVIEAYPTEKKSILNLSMAQDALVLGLINGGHLDNKDAFQRVLPFIEDLTLRKSIYRRAIEVNPNLKDDQLITRCNTIKQLTSVHHVSLSEAVKWSDPWQKTEVHILFLQGIVLIRRDSLPIDMFIHIASYVVGLPDEETKKLFEKHTTIMPKKLYEHSVHQLTFFDPRAQLPVDKYTKQFEEAANRYKNRVNFL